MKVGDSIRVINVVYAFRIVIKIEKINFSEFRLQIVFVHSISMERYIMKIKVILLGMMGLLLSNIVLANHEINFIVGIRVRVHVIGIRAGARTNGDIERGKSLFC